MGRFPLKQAAERLGISEDGVRKRLQRGTLKSVRMAGKLYVVLPDADPDTIRDRPGPASEREWLVDVLRERIDGQKQRISQLESTIDKLWERLSASEKARDDDRELLRAHLVNEQLLIRQIQHLKRLPAVRTEEKNPPPHDRYRGWRHDLLYRAV